MSATAPVAALTQIRVPGASMPLSRRLLISDVFVVAMVMVGAHAVRFGWEPFVPIEGPTGTPYVWLTVLISAVWVFQLGWTRSRDPLVLGEGSEEFQRVATASWLTFVVVVMFGFFTDLSISRVYLFLALPLGTLAILGYRAAWRVWLRERRHAGQWRERTVVAGPRAAVATLVRRMQANPAGRFEIVGVCVPQGSDRVDGPVVGAVDEAPQAASRLDADYVILAGTDELPLADARRLEWDVEDTGVPLLIAPSVSDIAAPRASVSRVEGLSLMQVQAAQFSGPKRLVKGAMDRVGALVALAVLGAPMLLLAAVVKFTSDGPVLFRQERVGRDLQPFQMLKFRSMYTDAEERLSQLHDASDGNGVLFKMRDDPRVTPIGKIMRRFSLDELPQLINVLRGEMSIVGPRPPLPREVEMWEEAEGVARRQLVKPGLTGLWQVSGRSDLSWEDSVRLDLHYTQNWTISLDAIILLRTAWAVLAGRGAY